MLFSPLSIRLESLCCLPYIKFTAFNPDGTTQRP